MAKSRSEINNAYAKKAYDSLRIIVPKGRKADIQNHAEINGKSLNAYINDLVCTDMKISFDEWRHKQQDEAPVE